MKYASVLPILSLALLLPACTSNNETLRKQGISEYQHGQFDQSLTTLNRSLSYDQFDPQANAYVGLLQYRQGHYEQASYYFKTALQSDPSSQEALEGLISSYVQLGKPDQALDFLERHNEVADQVQDPRWEKSNVKRRYQKQTEESLFTGKVNARLRIARTYEKLGDYDNALLYYKEALKLDPNSASANMYIATLYDKTGNKTAARDYLVRAYNIDPALPGLTELMT